MNTDFPRIITLLRKERKLSQKAAAAELSISQALLSHYEKGIRECGLDFLVKCADFYGVSCDYLLGRSPEQNGAVISVEEIPVEDKSVKENVFKGSVLTSLNKKLICNSLNILFDLLSKSNNKTLINEMSSYLMLSVYKMYRAISLVNPENQQEMFNVPSTLYSNFASAAMDICETKAKSVGAKEQIADIEKVKDSSAFTVTVEMISKEYPLFASSLFNLISNAEKKMDF